MATPPARLYEEMSRIRRFEESLFELFPSGRLRGTTHTYIGQEANAVGVLAQREANDIVVSNHRCHGHFLAYGGPMDRLAAELLGRSTGVCGGRGGSQHLQWQGFYSNGILGGTVPLAVGMARAESVLATRSVVVVFMGDGALGEGVVYESLNMASLWRLPILFVLENNRYAQTTPIELNLAGDLAGRFTAFGLPVKEADTTDALEIERIAHPLLQSVRAGEGPQALILHTYRFAPHSKGDDHRDPDEIARYKARDPLSIHAARLDPEEVAALEEKVEAEVQAAFTQAEAAPLADPSSLAPILDPAR